MKIRGRTVGTTLKPEAALVGATGLTDKQKAQARENIGVVVKYKESTKDDPIALGNLETGVYWLKGYFKQGSWESVTNDWWNYMANIARATVSGETVVFVQLFVPGRHAIHHYEINETVCTKAVKTVYLNDLMKKSDLDTSSLLEKIAYIKDRDAMEESLGLAFALPDTALEEKAEAEGTGYSFYKVSNEVPDLTKYGDYALLRHGNDFNHPTYTKIRITSGEGSYALHYVGRSVFIVTAESIETGGNTLSHGVWAYGESGGYESALYKPYRISPWRENCLVVMNCINCNNEYVISTSDGSYGFNGNDPLCPDCQG